MTLGDNALYFSVPASWGTQLTAITRLSLTNNAGVCGALPAPWNAAGSNRVQFSGTAIPSACPNPPPPPLPPPSPTNVLYALRLAADSWPATLRSWDGASDPCGGQWSGVLCSSTGPPEVVEVDISYSNIRVSVQLIPRRGTKLCPLMDSAGHDLGT